MIVYFTGTGNSRYCAEFLADRLNDDVLDSKAYTSAQIAADLTSEKPWVFVAPTYAWQMPRAFAEFIRKGAFKGDRRAWFVLTCGGEIGAAGKSLKKLCADVGLEYMGVAPVEMPNNYLLMFEVPKADEAEEIVGAAEKVLERAAEWIGNGRAFPQATPSFGDRVKSSVIAPMFTKFYASAAKFRVKPNCNGCGVCAEVCPLGNITIEHGKPVWGKRCTQCCACISRCRRKAIEYGKATEGKRRYLCKPYQREEKQ